MELKQSQLYPRIGTAVYILNPQNQLLLMRRAGSHGAGTWAPPGGKLEMRESFFDCAKRETKEESNVDIGDIKIIGITNDIAEDTHYVTIHMLAIGAVGEPKIMESNKCTEIGWFDLNNFPKPLFWSVENFLKLDPECLCGSGKKLKECHGK